ncbi:hypothetical protein FDECE_3052 [Fusarium decemcellulare]|nr:hypothetical protein FDECE_3052 [Fusarium decemcellulare]
MVLKTGDPLSQVTQDLLATDEKYTVGGFGPLPGYIVSAKGSTLTLIASHQDVDGKELIDLSCTMSAVNLGHSHPKVVAAVVQSIQNITQSNIAAHDVQWPAVAKALCEKLGYDKVAALVMGAEAADSAVKIARKWGILRKGISPDDVVVLGCSENYHGLTSGIWPIMDQDGGQEDYGVTSKNVTNCHPETGALLRYGHVEDFEAVLSELHQVITAVIMEPIHGTLRTFSEEIEFARGVRKLCKRYNVLFISDEVRMGAGKTGRFLCSDWLGSENRPGMAVLGKSITGGVYPASYVVGFNDTMALVEPSQVASTFAMSPAANAATLATLALYQDDALLKRAEAIQVRWSAVTSKWDHAFINYCTARGADLGIMVKSGVGNVTPRRIARLAYQRGVLTYPSGSRLRISVALTIRDDELEKAFSILTEVMDEIESYGEIPGSSHRADSY